MLLMMLKWWRKELFALASISSIFRCASVGLLAIEFWARERCQLLR